MIFPSSNFTLKRDAAKARRPLAPVGRMMHKYFLTNILALTIVGCAAPHKVEKIQDTSPQSNTFVLLSSGQWDAKLRAELSKKGFKILKDASRNSASAKGAEGEVTRVRNEADARYGLTLSWVSIDRCVENSSKVIEATLEVTDIKTKEVVLVIEKSGFTGPCGPPRDTVFDGLASELADSWRSK